MRIAIVGSRKIDTITMHEEVMELLRDGPWYTVVSGGAIGADTVAAECARQLGLGLIVHLPEWDKLGKRAGFARNHKIVDDCDEVHAWWDGKSKGTAHTIELARRAGKPVTVHRT